jgi:signal recognition particle GTPase
MNVLLVCCQEKESDTKRTQHCNDIEFDAVTIAFDSFPIKELQKPKTLKVSRTCNIC